MRGDDERASHLFSYLSPEQGVPADHPLRPIRAMTDEALRRLSLRFKVLYATAGRPSIPPEPLLRALDHSTLRGYGYLSLLAATALARGASAPRRSVGRQRSASTGRRTTSRSVSSRQVVHASRRGRA